MKLSKYLLTLFLVVISCLVMSSSIYGVFLNWDDVSYVITNSLVHEFSLESIKEIFLTPEFLGNYQPITLLFYAVEYSFFGADPLGYHIVALVLHAVNTVLVFQIVRTISTQIGVAFFTALLFGIHPAHVESVAWISGVKDLLYVMFFLLGLYYYETSKISGSKTRQIGVWLFFILALLSKGMAVVFPLVLVLLDYKRSGKFDRKEMLQKIPFFAVSLFLGIITYLSQIEGGATSDVSFIEQFFYGIYGFSRYVIFAVIPYPLSPLHPYPAQIGESIPAFVYVSGTLSVIGFAMLVFYLRKSKDLIFGLLFFTACIFPVLQFLSVGIAVFSERYTYLAYVGLFYSISLIIYRLYSSQAGLQKKWITIASFAVLSVYAYQSFVHAKSWKSDDSLWTQVITAYPNDFYGYFQRGSFRSKRGVFDLAIKDLTTSIVVYEGNPTAHLERGFVFMKQQKWDLALDDFLAVIKISPNHYVAQVNAGVVCMNLKRIKEAKWHLDTATKVNPNGVLGYLNRGILFTGMQKYKDAILDFEYVLKLNPGNQDALFLRGQSYFYLGNKNAANSDFSTLVDNYPQNPDYKIWLQKSRS